MNKIIKKKQGYAILELLFYIAFFATISLVAINALIIMFQSFREVSIQRDFIQAGVIMEKMTREIRQAYDISLIDVNNLRLNSTDNNGANKTVEFLLSDSNLQFLENGILIGNLNTPDIMVVGLTFIQVDTIKSNAVSIALTIGLVDDILGRTVTFYNTVVLRGGY